MLGPVPTVEVWPENWPAMLAFLSVQTQWRTGGMGGVTGLDYPAVKAGLHMAGIEVTPELFDKLHTLELAVLDERAKQAKRHESRNTHR